MESDRRLVTLRKLRLDLESLLRGSHPFSLHSESLGAPPVPRDIFETDFQKCLAQSEAFVMESKAVSRLIGMMLETIGLDVPIDVAVEYAARRMSTGEELPKDNPVTVGQFYDHVVLPVIKAQQDVVLGLITVHPELAFGERLIMRSGVKLARLFDEIFSAWWQYVIIPYQMGIAQDPTLKEAIREGPLNNRYAVIADSTGSPIKKPLTQELLASCREIPLATAFPRQIRRIRVELDLLQEDLAEFHLAVVYQRYFNALSSALRNRDLEKMEDLWHAVDVAWVGIRPERVMPVHMMENGYHHPRQVTPEFRILWRSESFQEEIALVRKGMERFGSRIGDDLVQTKLNRIDIGTFNTVLAGGCVDFRIAGQSVPNRPDVQKLGMKIFLDSDTMEKRHLKFVNLVKACADGETSAWTSEAMNLAFHVCVVTSHEFAHPFLITERVIEAFDQDKPTFEEGKATLFGIMGLEEINQEYGSDFYRTLSAYLLGEILHRFDKRRAQDPTFRPYLNEAMMIATSLLQREVIVLVDGKIHMNQDWCSTPGVVQVLKEVTDKLIAAYRQADICLAEGLSLALGVVDEFAPGVEDPKLQALYEIVNRNLYKG